MSNIYEFPTAFQSSHINVDWRLLAFESMSEMEGHLRASLTWDDPTLLIRVMCAIARSLLEEDYTATKAIADGWADLATARRRGLDLLSLIAALPPASRAV